MKYLYRCRLRIHCPTEDGQYPLYVPLLLVAWGARSATCIDSMLPQSDRPKNPVSAPKGPTPWCCVQIDLVKGMMDCLYAECKPCITDCVIAELEKLGQRYRVALKVAKVGLTSQHLSMGKQVVLEALLRACWL